MIFERLPAHAFDKVWGRTGLPTVFAADAASRIGEVWFDPPAQLAGQLVKYLFTSEMLSVQVHPGPDDTPGASGKDECWLILATEPEARLAIGLREAIGAEALRAAALDGTIEDLLAWHRPQPGDFYSIPAGTIHAIGPGITLVEVQQDCDITYRLYDYGRPRDLHLDAAVRVARAAPWSRHLHRKVDAGATEILLEGPFFRVGHCHGGRLDVLASWRGAIQVVPLEGTVSGGRLTIGPGESGWCDDLGELRFSPQGRTLLAQPISG